MMEDNLIAVLKTVCPRVYQDIAPNNPIAPYVMWQGIGGKTMRALDGDHCNERNTLVMVKAWAKTGKDRTELAHAIEDALIASPLFQVVRPESGPLNVYEADTKMYGAIQRFSIWATRT